MPVVQGAGVRLSFQVHTLFTVFPCHLLSTGASAAVTGCHRVPVCVSDVIPDHHLQFHLKFSSLCYSGVPWWKLLAVARGSTHTGVCSFALPCPDGLYHVRQRCNPSSAYGMVHFWRNASCAMPHFLDQPHTYLCATQGTLSTPSQDAASTSAHGQCRLLNLSIDHGQQVAAAAACMSCHPPC